jgi:dihydrofolate reductase
MWNVMTLDGYFEGTKSWDLDFHQSVWGPELEALSIEQLHSADRLIFGRVTYEGMAAYWTTAQGEVADLMNRLPKVVFSRTLQQADWSNTTLIKEDAAARVPELKRKGEGNSFVFGSANLSRTLISHGLFDEYRLAVAPMILGRGTPLFGPDLARVPLTLLETRTLPSGGVILRYQPSGTP